jgi:ABC-type uncharacterized transport system auxiliary subunit
MKSLPIALLLAGAALAACVGTRDPVEQTTYLPALTPLPPAPLPERPIAIARFQVAPHLSGERLVARVEPTRLEHYQTHRWAGPLSDVVTAELRHALRPQLGELPQDLASPGGLLLSGTIARFEEEDEPDGWFGRVGLSFVLREVASGRILASDYVVARRPAAAQNPADVVLALCDAFQEVALEIASRVREAAGAAPASPPG